MEEQIWNYIDGTCSDAEKIQFEKQLTTNVELKKMYQELVQLNLIFKQTELEEPSMRFAMNVMDTINASAAFTPLKTVVDQRIIKSISIFFIASISVLVLYALWQVQWSFYSSTTTAFHFELPSLEVPSVFNGTVVNLFIMFDVVIGLLLLDKVLRFKKESKHIHS